MAEPEKPELRFEFVGMMFAVAAGEIGMKCAVIVQHAAPQGQNKIIYCLPAICHLLIATLLVATSWVGWSRSRVSLGIRDVHTIFSGPFAVLLIDVLLVIFYFIVVDTVELSVNESTGILEVASSATSESFWVFMIFFGYFVWDLLTKAFIRQEQQPKPKGLRDSMRALAFRFVSRNCWNRAWVSAFLVVLSLCTWFLFRHLTAYISVIFANLSLIALLLLFRALKDLCSAIIPKSCETIDDFNERKSSELPVAIRWAVFCSLTAIMSTFAACFA
jgi:hypothetical protein